MNTRNWISGLILALSLLLVTDVAVAAVDAVLLQNIRTAAEAVTAAPNAAARAVLLKQLQDAVKAAIAANTADGDATSIISAAVTGDPVDVGTIVGAAQQARPGAITEIVAAALSVPGVTVNPQSLTLVVGANNPAPTSYFVYTPSTPGSAGGASLTSASPL